MKKQILYKKVVQSNGFELQLRKLQEECCELGTAINHFLTDRGKGYASLHEEFVDVEILIEQLRHKLDCKMLSQVKDYKIKRLERRLKDGKLNGAKNERNRK